MARMRMRKLTIPAAAIIGLTASTTGMLAQATPQSFPNAPEGFDVQRPGVATGRVERIEYTSSVTGGKKPAMVYTAPGLLRPRRSIRCSICCMGSAATRTHWTQFRGPPPPFSTT